MIKFAIPAVAALGLIAFAAQSPQRMSRQPMRFGVIGVGGDNRLSESQRARGVIGKRGKGAVHRGVDLQ